MSPSPTKVLVVAGTRPEAIKMAPLVLELQRRPGFIPVLCATAQHRQMLDSALGMFGLVPDVDLDVMRQDQTLASLTGRLIEGLERTIAAEAPDVVLVQGDTTTAFCGALAAFYRRVSVGHVEAGLRTGNRFSPFPEEVNRRLVAPLADFHFAPTSSARDALLTEGIAPAMVHVTGNTVIDALLWMRDRVATTRPALPADVAALSLDDMPMVLVTGHRRESFGDGFEQICRAIRDAADARPGVRFVYPVHLNPNVREPVNRLLGAHPRIHLVEPVDYAAFVWLMDRATVLLTDSGGVQEEGPSLGKPVLVMRDTTERPEGVIAGTARLVGTRHEQILRNVLELLDSADARDAMARAVNPYGDGTAARRIVDVLAGVATLVPASSLTGSPGAVLGAAERLVMAGA